MRYLIVLLVLAGCANDAYVTKAHKAYTTCLDARGVDGCAVEKAKLDAALRVADAESRYNSSRPPLVLSSPTPVVQEPIYAPRPPVICNTVGGTTICN